MDRDTLELYLYMGNSKKIIEWLNSEGCTTRQQVIDKLAPIAKSNVMAVARSIGANVSNAGSISGTCNAVEKILEKYPEE